MVSILPEPIEVFSKRTGLDLGAAMFGVTALAVAADVPAAVIDAARKARESMGELVQICTGTADDVKINAMLTALATPGGKGVLIGAAFNTTAAITFPAGGYAGRKIVLEGQGAGTSITYTTATGNVVEFIGGGTNATSCQNNQLKNFTLYALNTAGALVYLQSCHSNLVEDVWIRCDKGTAFHVAGGCLINDFKRIKHGSSGSGDFCLYFVKINTDGVAAANNLNTWETFNFQGSGATKAIWGSNGHHNIFRDGAVGVYDAAKDLVLLDGTSYEYVFDGIYIDGAGKMTVESNMHAFDNIHGGSVAVWNVTGIDVKFDKFLSFNDGSQDVPIISALPASIFQNADILLPFAQRPVLDTYNLKDYSKYGKTFGLYVTPTWGTTATNWGKVSFNGSTQYGRSLRTFSLTGTTKRTFIMAVSPTFNWNDGATHHFWNWRYSATDYIEMYKATNLVQFGWNINAAGAESITYTPSFSSGDFLVLIGTIDFDTDVTKIYENGVLKNTGTTAATAYSTDVDYLYLAGYEGHYNCPCDIMFFSMLPYILSDEQVEEVSGLLTKNINDYDYLSVGETRVYKKIVNYDDTSPVVCATVADGYCVTEVWVEVTTTFDDGGAALDIGDGNDADGFLATAKIDLTTAGYYGFEADDGGAYLWDAGNTHRRQKIYTGADTIDCTITKTDGTQGVAIVYTKVTRIF